MRLIPDDPFPEIGHPFTTDVSADGRWIAVSCYASGRGDGGRIAVYRTSDLALWDQIVLEQGIEGLAFHPALPVLAVGTEEGDEFELRGGLLLYEPETRRRTDVAVAGAGVSALRWRDACRLEVTFARPVVDYEDLGRVTYTRSVVERPDWQDVTADVLAALVSSPQVPVEVDWSGIKGPDIDQPQRYLAGIAAERGRAWARRPGVAVVEVLRDGRILAAAQSGVLLECWSPDGTPQWSVPVPDSQRQRNGCRVYVTPDEESAWITVLVGDSSDRRTLLCRFALTDGAQLAESRLDFPVAIAARTDGAWVARDSRELFPGPRWPPYDSVVLTPSGRQLATLALGESDSSYDFTVRRSPHLLFLYGVGGGEVRTELLEKWVVRADPNGVEKLFPLAWHEALGPHLRGGPAAYVDDDAGQGLVHTCTARDGTYLVRRAYPDGAVAWVHRFDARVTGVDVHGGLVHAVTGAGACELLTLRAEEGTVVRRRALTLSGHLYTPTCLSAGPDGDLVIGTVEGRLIRTRADGGALPAPEVPVAWDARTCP
ncbi:hypothetical protein OHB53_05585 [Streptomyces sp. NBC_00056]|jgi:outer membrane protein assembly factor BamB|uniref:hypothetical protein n=1 Tax=unclassified Streptomyces TaxID=2593676 RepID=UPI002E808D9C|nr:hypothetical protein [Streptomyces sp. NBC_00569]WUB91835.1 hypothetical protein OHO83_05560 [Streptomyces sp. NBC_00569]